MQRLCTGSPRIAFLSLQAFASAFWRPTHLHQAYPPSLRGPSPPPCLACLPLVAEHLRHLELSAPALWDLSAVAACPRLVCLSLRGCRVVPDTAFQALQRCSTLEALDLGGIAQLSNGAAFHIAKGLPRLAALNLSGTAVTDHALQLLTYGCKVRRWESAQGARSLPPEAAAWPPLPLQHLQLQGTRVTAAGLAELEHLAALRCVCGCLGGLAAGCVERRLQQRVLPAGHLLAGSSTSGRPASPVPPSSRWRPDLGCSWSRLRC